MRTKYMIWDLETENNTTYGRFCNPFDPVNFVVARGWKVQGDAKCSHSLHTLGDDAVTHIPKDIKVLVGHNIKFDMLYEWENIKEFLRDGGTIWDTQYAEYLLEAQAPAYHMNSLEQLSEKYGGTNKLNLVKQMWDKGLKTTEIPQALLVDYLIGSEKEGRNAGDIGNTERVFLKQVARAVQSGMLAGIKARMDGLLCTTEMEYNGLFINMQEGLRKTEELRKQLASIQEELNASLPPLPKGLEFNWGSRTQLSCLLFGGSIKYCVREPIIDDTGLPVFIKRKVMCGYVNGVPIPMDKIQHPEVEIDVYTSGKLKGDPKIKEVSIVTDEPRTKIITRYFKLPGFVKGNPKHLMESKTALDEPLYSTSSTVLESLRGSSVPFIQLLLKRADIAKDLGTYYLVQDGDNKAGMLAHVMPNGIIHHHLNHTTTVTTRLSSTNPNLQNIPREDTSEVKKMFISRYPDGKMLEIDYNQLEIVGQAFLSGDANLIQDVINKIDMHCRRVSAKFHIPYSDAVYFCKDETAPDHTLWKHRRTGAKAFSFQRAFGAGATKIAESTGMTVREVEDMIAAEEALYPGIVQFNTKVSEAVHKSAIPFRDPVTKRVYRRGWYTAPTGTRYSFRSYDAPDYLVKRGIQESFKPTEMKNYPVQGTSGEFVQIVLGKLFRLFLTNRNYSDKALLVNTVHDCVWADCAAEVLREVAKDMIQIMQNIPLYLKQIYNIDCPVPFRVEAEFGSDLYTKEKLHI